MKQSRKIKLEPGNFRAFFEPKTFNKEKRTVDVVWTTGSRVKRYDWWTGDSFYEELSLDPKEVRLDRLNNGAPLLNNHNSWDLRDVIGVVERAEIKDGKGTATVRFSQRDEVQDIIQDIEAGIIRNISVGYKIHKFEEQEELVDKMPVFRAVDWEPLELSFVGIPADSGAQARSEKPMQYVEATITEREENMGKKKESNVSTPAQAAIRSEESVTETTDANPVDPSIEAHVPATEPSKEGPDASEGDAPAVASTEERKETVETATAKPEEIRAQEIERQKQIRGAVRLAKLDESFADELVGNDKMTVEGARAEIFKKLEAQTSSATKNQRVEVKDMDQKQLRKEAAVRAMLHRYDNNKYTLKDDEREFRQGSLIDTARHFLALEGVRDAYTMCRDEVAKRSLHHSSDFAEVLANTANKTLRDAYMGAPNTYAPFVAQKSVSDFKQISSVQLSNGGKLEKVNEHGEYKRTSVSESAEKYKVEKYGIIVGRTYELMVNDDLDAFTRIPAQLGIRAREKENEIFWSLILANGLMAETGLALFSSGHDNLAGVGGAIAVATLSAARAKMRVKKDLDGELMNLSPSWLVVPASLETIAEQFISQNIMAEQAGNTNPFYNKLKLVVEPRLDANSVTAWYAFADKAQQAIGEMALLDGKGPEIFTREGFDVDGMEVKLRHHFGMKVIDYRGVYKNPGA